MDPKLKPCDALEGPSHVQHGATGALWRPLRTNLRPTEAQDGEHCSRRSIIDAKNQWKTPSENKCFDDFALGWPFPPW